MNADAHLAKVIIVSTRLKFVRDKIEPLSLGDRFEIQTPDGMFRMTKADFHKVFSNVVESPSYRVAGWYGYVKTPEKAMPFKVSTIHYIQKPQKTKYDLPNFLHSKVTPAWYKRWLSRKSLAHTKRDRKRGNLKANYLKYKQAIHDAVLASEGRDAYTGDELGWELLSQWDNQLSKDQGRKYKKQFARLPTVDHVGDGLGEPDFAICSWQSNDAKNDMPYDELVDFCTRVLRHRDRISNK